jgi:hypothetical protein
VVYVVVFEKYFGDIYGVANRNRNKINKCNWAIYRWKYTNQIDSFIDWFYHEGATAHYVEECFPAVVEPDVSRKVDWTSRVDCSPDLAPMALFM